MILTNYLYFKEHNIYWFNCVVVLDMHLGHKANRTDLKLSQFGTRLNSSKFFLLEKTASILWPMGFKEKCLSSTCLQEISSRNKNTWCAWQPVHLFVKKPTNTGYLLFKESLKLLMYGSKPCCQGMVGNLHLSTFNNDGFQLWGKSLYFMTDEWKILWNIYCCQYWELYGALCSTLMNVYTSTFCRPMFVCFELGISHIIEIIIVVQKLFNIKSTLK